VPKIDYAQMSEDDFQRILLDEVLANMTAADLVLTVPNVFSDVREHFNNEVLDRWAADQDLIDEDDIEEAKREFHDD
jgi:hypothetical protein